MSVSPLAAPRERGDNVRKSVFFPPRLWAEVKAFMHANYTESENEAIRRLITAGLRQWRASEWAGHIDLDLASPGDLPRE